AARPPFRAMLMNEAQPIAFQPGEWDKSVGSSSLWKGWRQDSRDHSPFTLHRSPPLRRSASHEGRYSRRPSAAAAQADDHARTGNLDGRLPPAAARDIAASGLRGDARPGTHHQDDRDADAGDGSADAGGQEAGLRLGAEGRQRLAGGPA